MAFNTKTTFLRLAIVAPIIVLYITYQQKYQTYQVAEGSYLFLIGKSLPAAFVTLLLVGVAYWIVSGLKNPK